MTRIEVKKTVLQFIEEEYGTPSLDESKKIVDMGMDSFSIVSFFLLIDNEFHIFKDIEEGIDPFSTIDINNITLKEVIDICFLMNTK